MRKVVLCLGVALLAACGGPAIQSVQQEVVRISPLMSPDARAEAIAANRLDRNRPGAVFVVRGRGTCGAIRVRMGDGTNLLFSPADFSGGGLRFAYTYTGWPGPKRLTAETVRDCLGRATSEVTVQPATMRAGFAMTGAPGACAIDPRFPAVRAGTRVTIRRDAPERLVNVGGVVNVGIDGSPVAALGPPFAFPFPGLRAHSLVMRVGAQVVQGGDGASFVVARTAPLEFCINDDVPADNRGAWRFFVTVDERGAEPAVP